MRLLLNNLSNRVTLIIMLAFLLSQVGIFQKLLTKKKLETEDKIILILIFGLIGIMGTYMGMEIKGALVNARVIGVFVGGLLGGPVVGIFSGILAGLHRYIIDIGGFSALACSISTILEGTMAGYLSRDFERSEYKVWFALAWGAVAEVFQMLIILIVAKPFEDAIELVSLIGIPMIVANGLGIAAFIFIIDSITKEIDKEAAYQAQSALKIADKTLKYFRTGYNKEIAEKVAKIIKEDLNIDAVALTDREKILAHIGVGSDHHNYGLELQTDITKEVIEKGNFSVSKSKRDIGCNHKKCPLQSAIVVPLEEDNDVIGTLKLYKTKSNDISEVEKEIALGLAKIFSTQIALSKIDKQEDLLVKAELKMLQAQINPHFLFNAINTISSLIRIDPDKSRELLIHLGKYFRNNLGNNFDDIPLKEEIENINSYLEIEKARFGDKLSIKYDIPEDINCKLPPLIIQPIVENAVKHGIVNTLKGGTVLIKAEDFINYTKIIVEDDGAGMDERLIKTILNNKKYENKVGLANVNSRLINKYGDSYSLNVNSKIGVGTRVEIIIPK